jgi:hypothetical protein
MACRIWSQPDPRHWRPLCTNSFQREGVGNSCIVCASPYPWNHCQYCSGNSPGHYRIVEGEVTGSGDDLVFSDEYTQFVPTGTSGAGETFYYRHHEFGWDTLKSFFESAVILPIPRDDEEEICEWGVGLISEIGYRVGVCKSLTPTIGRNKTIDTITIQPTYTTPLELPQSKYLWPSGFGTATDTKFVTKTTGESIMPDQPSVTEKFIATRAECQFVLRATYFNDEMTLSAAPAFKREQFGIAINSSGAELYCATFGNPPNFSSVYAGYPSTNTPTSAQWKSGELSGCLDLARIPMEKVSGGSQWPDDIVLAKSTW